jgi:hypothetical protein
MSLNTKEEIMKHTVSFCSIISFLMFLCCLDVMADNNAATNDSLQDTEKSYLPGQEVVSAGGKKVRVWSTKGSIEVSKPQKPSAPSEPFEDVSDQVSISGVVVDARTDAHSKDK